LFLRTVEALKNNIVDSIQSRVRKSRASLSLVTVDVVAANVLVKQAWLRRFRCG